MEGSGMARTADINRRDINEIFRRAGLPATAAAAWVKARPRVNGALKRDSAGGTKFWRRGAGLLEKLPKKPKRTPEQQMAARHHPVRLPSHARRISELVMPKRFIESSPKIFQNFGAWMNWHMLPRN